MSNDLANAVTRFLDRLGSILEGDADLRGALAELARATARRLDGATVPPGVTGQHGDQPIPGSPAQSSSDGPEAAASPSVGPTVQELAAQLTFHRPAEPAPPTATAPADELVLVPLGIVASRCRLKADASRLAAARSGEDPLATTDSEVLARAASLPDCYLWMLSRDTPVCTPLVWSDLAGAFETAARAAELLRDWEAADTRTGDLTERVLGLAAEAQAVLYYAVADARTVSSDHEQTQLYARVRHAARTQRLFIRNLSRTDRADPASWPNLRTRIDAVLDELRSRSTRDRAHKKKLANLRHRTAQLAGDGRDDPDVWQRVIELTDDLVNAGVAPSAVELRECLLPLFDRLETQPDLPPSLEQVLRALEAYRLLTTEQAPVADERERYGVEVTQAADLLCGREIVLIGGLDRPDRRDALVQAFTLADLNWVTTDGHVSHTIFEAPIARPEVAVVLLATRWISHSYQNVKDYCDRYDKAFVKLPAGYHPNQVAHQILVQAGDRLRAGRTD